MYFNTICFLYLKSYHRKSLTCLIVQISCIHVTHLVNIVHIRNIKVLKFINSRVSTVYLGKIEIKNKQKGDYIRRTRYTFKSIKSIIFKYLNKNECNLTMSVV